MKPYVWAFGILILSTQGFSLPQYSLKEGKQCGFCHYARQGGGPTNARGRYYGKHFTFDGYVNHLKMKKKSLVKTGVSESGPTPEQASSPK